MHKCRNNVQPFPQQWKWLARHYIDGTNLVDHTSYESGGSVVYKLTSAAYVPSPRNDGLVGGVTGRRRAAYEYEKRRMFDAHPLVEMVGKALVLSFGEWEEVGM
eukprot:CAMPEP_0201966718 /NCGR_PEP_ID=MMETSP0904-20121228/11608_1 /ASSEMBLY_ACC=CAM_ASM_000553 /TAXON_ID=420261 /ORGANISM="Thalassiosira antarctica, Strain CCMP982" /LENGTH=103 /DNA_ID=CAMNT_0048514011 /DNA_START=111 /DNA_END=423 /DNA_ORIENTATION=+